MELKSLKSKRWGQFLHPCSDFIEAFDKVNHDIVLSKVEFYGSYGVSLYFLKSYLNGRTVKLCSMHSTSSRSWTVIIPHIYQWHAFICPTISFVCSGYLRIVIAIIIKIKGNNKDNHNSNNKDQW